MMRVLFLGLLVLLVACSRPAELTVISGPTMGSHYSVKVLLPPDRSKDQLQHEIQSLLDAIEQVASTWKADSELSRFNQAPVGAFPASDTLRDLIAVSLRACQETDGALDVTVAPLVNLWGFGPHAVPEHLPDPERIAEAKARVGCQHLSIDGKTVVKDAPVVVDLSAVTQGYAGVMVARLLDGWGVATYLVDMSGELVSRGNKPDGSHWRIAVEVPQLGKLIPGGGVESIEKVVALKGKAIATSGDYRNFVELDGHTVSHIIDPVTGAPVTHGLASVTVLDDDLTWADAMATAIMVMGPEKGLVFAESRHLPVLLVVRTNDEFVEKMTGPFAQYVTPL